MAKIHVVVSASKKRAHVFQGKKLLKTYRFKMDIPFVMVEKECQGYDYGEWSVSERSYTYKKMFKVWDERVIEDIKKRVLIEFNK